MYEVLTRIFNYLLNNLNNDAWLTELLGKSFVLGRIMKVADLHIIFKFSPFIIVLFNRIVQYLKYFEIHYKY